MALYLGVNQLGGKNPIMSGAKVVLFYVDYNILKKAYYNNDEIF